MIGAGHMQGIRRSGPAWQGRSPAEPRVRPGNRGKAPTPIAAPEGPSLPWPAARQVLSPGSAVCGYAALGRGLMQRLPYRIHEPLAITGLTHHACRPSWPMPRAPGDACAPSMATYGPVIHGCGSGLPSLRVTWAAGLTGRVAHPSARALIPVAPCHDAPTCRVVVVQPHGAEPRYIRPVGQS